MPSPLLPLQYAKHGHYHTRNETDGQLPPIGQDSPLSGGRKPPERALGTLTHVDQSAGVG